MHAERLNTQIKFISTLNEFEMSFKVDLNFIFENIYIYFQSFRKK